MNEDEKKPGVYVPPKVAAVHYGNPLYYFPCSDDGNDNDDNIDDDDNKDENNNNNKNSY